MPARSARGQTRQRSRGTEARYPPHSDATRRLVENGVRGMLQEMVRASCKSPTPSPPRVARCGGLSHRIADTCHPHQHFRLTTKGDQNFRTENQNVADGEDGKENLGHCALQITPPHTPRDCIVHNLPNGRSSPETQQGPRPQDGGCEGGFADPLQIALNMSFPRTVEQLSHRRPPLCSTMCPFTVPSSLAQPLSCTQCDSLSHSVLWGHLWLGRAWC